jgi:hypothetical protein
LWWDIGATCALFLLALGSAPPERADELARLPASCAGVLEGPSQGAHLARRPVDARTMLRLAEATLSGDSGRSEGWPHVGGGGGLLQG